ncbi:MAG: ATP-binding protein [Burkholderiaceae bacterium]|nr:ATP-binding protein [Burkholderiaceae bacterium]
MTFRPFPTFLDHAGECAGLLRADDAPTAPGIGAPADWPAELQLLTGLMLGASEPMFVAWGPERLFFYNDAYAPILGARHPAALGQPMQQLWSDIWVDIGPLVDRCFAGHSVQMDDIALSMQRGDRIEEAHFSFGYHPVRDVQGAVTGLFCVCRETTVQRREQADRDAVAARLVRAEAERQISEERFQAAVRAVGLMWTQNALGEMEGEQRGWSDLTGQTPVQYRGDGWSTAIHPDDVQPTLIAWRQAVSQQRHFEWEHRLRNADGEWRRYAVCAEPVFAADGRLREWVGVHIDVTEARRSAESLRQADQRKDEFLAILSHELRNPLAPIRSAASVLANPALTAQELAVSRDVINRQIRHMARLLDDLLDISRISAGRLELEKQLHPLQAIVGGAVENARSLIDSRQHTLEIDLPPGSMTQVDEVRMTQVLANLLLNAASYTPPGGCIRLVARADDHELLIEVHDNGIGITPEQLPYVFDMFSQLRSASDRSQGGLGIGLALSRGLVELHGGLLDASSAGLGGGATFRIHLPPAAFDSRPAALDDVPAALAAPTPTPLRILIADDNRDAADSLALLLRLEHHEVHVAFAGASALAMAMRVQPQVAVLDIGMPGLDGYEVARRLRLQPGGPDMLILALTGWGRQEDQRKALAAGFDRHCTKPIDPMALIDCMNAWRSNRPVTR